MSLVLEDGTGKADAESYISVADADTYFAASGNSDWTGTTAVKEAALRVATLFVDRRYAWPGWITVAAQRLAWPRSGVLDADGRIIAVDAIPQDVKNATCEAAVEHLRSPLNEVRARGGAIQSASVGSISVTYADGASAGRTYPYLDFLLQNLVGAATPGILTMVSP